MNVCSRVQKEKNISRIHYVNGIQFIQQDFQDFFYIWPLKHLLLFQLISEVNC